MSVHLSQMQTLLWQGKTVWSLLKYALLGQAEWDACSPTGGWLITTSVGLLIFIPKTKFSALLCILTWWSWAFIYLLWTSVFILLFTYSHFYFLNYILLIMVLQLSQFFSLCPPPSSTTHSFWQSWHHCSCPWVTCIGSLVTPFSILYFTSPCYSVTTYLYFLVPSPFHLFPHTPLWQLSKCSPYPWFCFCPSCLLSLFFRFDCR